MTVKELIKALEYYENIGDGEIEVVYQNEDLDYEPIDELIINYDKTKKRGILNISVNMY